MAKIVVLTAGSTGDVEPFAALAARLVTRGHGVVLAADAGFERLAPDGGVAFAPIRADFRSLLPTPGRKRPSLRREAFPLIRGMLEDAWTVARDVRPDVIVAHQKSLAAAHLAERLGIPHVQALTVPMLTPTREFPLPAVVRVDLGGRLNRASYRLVGLLSGPYTGVIRRWRRDQLGLAPGGRSPAPARTLYCYSPSLVPTPRDWPSDAVATGYWVRDDGAAPDPPGGDLEDFVASALPPVYIGFGSAVGTDPARLGAQVAGAVREAGVRAVVATGWGGMADVGGRDTLVVERAPHRWLFPRVAAVVHHGGAGTTAAGLLAGRPTVVCPFQGDQHFWGAAVRRSGAGPAPLPVGRITAGRLAAAIRTAVEDPGIHARAAALGQRIGVEDGTGRAAEEIEALLR